MRQSHCYPLDVDLLLRHDRWVVEAGALGFADAQRGEREVALGEDAGGGHELFAHCVLEVAEKVGFVGEVPFEGGFDGGENFFGDVCYVATAGCAGKAGHFEGDAVDGLEPSGR